MEDMKARLHRFAKHCGQGFTLIESVVVIAILAILALVSINTITEFQRNAILTSATQELGSTLRVAKADSTSGLVKTGEVYTDTGYPYYGITLNGNTYQLTRTFTLSGGSAATENLETHAIDPSITVLPASTAITFTRITGVPSGAVTVTLTRTGTTTFRTVTVNANGLISL